MVAQGALDGLEGFVQVADTGRRSSCCWPGVDGRRCRARRGRRGVFEADKARRARSGAVRVSQRANSAPSVVLPCAAGPRTTAHGWRCSRRWSASSSRLRPRMCGGSSGSAPRRAGVSCASVLTSLAGILVKSCGSSFSWKRHGHEPVLEPQFARAEDAAAEGVVLQPRWPASMASPTRAPRASAS